MIMSPYAILDLPATKCPITSLDAKTRLEMISLLETYAAMPEQDRNSKQSWL